MHFSQLIFFSLVTSLSGALTISKSARCGGSTGLTCLGSEFGDCCSSHGWCGSVETYCGSGCQSEFGTCHGGSAPANEPTSSEAAVTRTAASETGVATSSETGTVASSAAPGATDAPASGQAGAYSLKLTYDASNFFDKFSFFTVADPTDGFVDYIPGADAMSSGLARVVDGKVYLGVDNSSIISSDGGGRRSVRLESKSTFTSGLLIGDIEHMPGSQCGLWPAFWTINNMGGADGVPYSEIDIIENTHDAEKNIMTLHTSDVCTFTRGGGSGSGSGADGSSADTDTGTLLNGDCNLDSDSGCNVQGQTGTYGDSFNDLSGGVYALQLEATGIKLWWFPRARIPADITAGNPDPSSAAWGLPMADFSQGNCDVGDIFFDQTIIFNIDFCGASAGGQGWADWSDCPTKTGYDTCKAYVAENPHVYDDAYFLLNSLKLYQQA